MKFSVKSTLSLVLSVVLLAACRYKDDAPAPANPFDQYKNAVINPTIDYKPDSNTIEGIHFYILSKSCASPGCHDGHFEPDYRTVQSSYSTLVYHPVVKNNATNSFEYRVKPGDVANSWLHERLVTGDANLGRMPLYSEQLSALELNSIKNWINNGAKDVYGNDARLPDRVPQLRGYAAFLPSLGDYRVDTIRGDKITNPFAVLTNSAVDIWIDVEDDYGDIKDLKINQLKFSKSYFDFSSAKVLTATYSPTPKIVPKFRDIDGKLKTASLHWKVSLNTADYAANDLVFMRYYTQDATHSVTEFPRTDSPQKYLTYSAIYVVQP